MLFEKDDPDFVKGGIDSILDKIRSFLLHKMFSGAFVVIAD